MKPCRESQESVAAARVRVRHELYAPIEPYRSGTLAVSDVHTVYWEESGNPKGQSVAAARVRVRHELYAPIEPYRSGTLAVSDVHTVYWEESGNPKGQPVIFLHGGPGGGTSPANRRFFDPTFFRIILLDQRGAGRSTPHACLEENTTWHLVEDIETLRKHLGVDKWLVFGGSWGSTLSLVYAATHPDRVAGLILRGIFLLRRKEVEWFYQKGADSIFPDGETKTGVTPPLPPSPSAPPYSDTPTSPFPLRPPIQSSRAAFDRYQEFIPSQGGAAQYESGSSAALDGVGDGHQLPAAAAAAAVAAAAYVLSLPLAITPGGGSEALDGVGDGHQLPAAAAAAAVAAAAAYVLSLPLAITPGGGSAALDGVGDGHQLPAAQ
ncbi:unnamed protein product [Closterium sp. Naga37s-1]|nr:unnamed protein product [Closterium sp. Naga37s-1]